MQVIPPFVTRANTSRFIRVLALVLPLLVVSVVLSQSVLAKNTYVITDGDQVITYTGYASTPEDVLDEAGLELNELDLYTTQETDGVAEIKVRRSQRIIIDNCGERMEASTYGESLTQLLQRLGVSYEGIYQVSLPLDTQTYDGMQVTITSNVTDEQTYTAEIPYEISYCDDPSLPVGEEKVIMEGQIGQKLCVANVSYENGVETGRTLVEETVVTEPVNKIIAVGTGEKTGKPADAVLFGDGFIVLPTGEVLTYTHAQQFKATAYTSWIADVTGTTATGTKARVGAIAVDPSLIPYGTRMFIVTNDGQYVYGIATAEDCGGGVKGNHVDLFFDTKDECIQFGVRQCTIYFLGDADRRGPQN